MRAAPAILIDATCPLCAADDAEPHLTAPDAIFGFPGEFHVVRCRACEMLYTRPRPAPEHIGAFYPREYSAHLEDRAVAHAHRRGRDPWDSPPPLGRMRLLDVGCGSGHYMLRMQARGWTVRGIEPSADAVAAARRLGLDAEVGVIPGIPLPEGEFDLVTLLGVIGMLPAPLETLRALHAALSPGGRIIITASNAASAAAATFGPHWFGWDLPRQLNHFTAATFQQMLARAGFEDVSIQYKLRTSHWRHGVARLAESRGGIWRLLARSRNLTGAYARLCSVGTGRNELIATARRGP